MRLLPPTDTLVSPRKILLHGFCISQGAIGRSLALSALCLHLACAQKGAAPPAVFCVALVEQDPPGGGRHRPNSSPERRARREPAKVYLLTAVGGKIRGRKKLKLKKITRQSGRISAGCLAAWLRDAPGKKKIEGTNSGNGHRKEEPSKNLCLLVVKNDHGW